MIAKTLLATAVITLVGGILATGLYTRSTCACGGSAIDTVVVKELSSARAPAPALSDAGSVSMCGAAHSAFGELAAQAKSAKAPPSDDTKPTMPLVQKAC